MEERVDTGFRNLSLVVLGGSGFVGRHVRRAAAHARARVWLVARTPTAISAGETLVVGRLEDPDTFLPELPRGAVVINLAYSATGDEAANIAMADGMARVCESTGAIRLVHVSTAVVAGVTPDPWVTERTECRPATAYQRTKLAVERRLMERLTDRCPVVILRPSAVFGAGGANLRKVVRDLVLGRLVVNYLRACLFGARPMNLVPVETVAAAVMFAASAEAAVRDGLYIVADDEAPGNTFREVEAVLRAGLALPRRPVPVLSVPLFVLDGVLRLAGRRAFNPRTRFSSARLSAAGFVRPMSFQDAVVRYAAIAQAEALETPPLP